ncbi:MAG: BamA/TamA family outer membrane protein, partial [Candidatus Eremiobacteraeota bacterium]|nr:BamA/TamA family outer membrane protein [Candidatus Eremiobacteraeota bacterium]
MQEAIRILVVILMSLVLVAGPAMADVRSGAETSIVKQDQPDAGKPSGSELTPESSEQGPTEADTEKEAVPISGPGQGGVQGTIPVKEKIQPEPAPSSEIAPESTTPTRISAIEIIGNRKIPSEEIISDINMKVGDEVSESLLAENMQAVFDMGYFTDVKIGTEYYLGGVKVIFRVLENPEVKKIEISGNEIVPTDKIISLIKTKEGDILNTRTIFEDVQAINKYYDEELGLLLSPTHVTDMSWDKNGILSLQITEGMIVSGINVEGNTVISTESIKKLITVKPGEYLNQKDLKHDTEAIAKLYEKKDYILDTIRPSIDPGDRVVTFNIIEAVCEKIKVEGNTKTREYVIRRNIRTKVNQVLRKRRLQRDLERLNNLGYFESVEMTPEPGSGPGKVVLVVKVKDTKTGLLTLGFGYSGGGSGVLRSGVTGAISYSERNLAGKGQRASFGWQRGTNIDSINVSFFDPTINDQLDSFGFSFYNTKMMELRQPYHDPGDPDLKDKYALYDDRRYGGSISYGKMLGEDFRTLLTLRHEHLEITTNPGSEYPVSGLTSGSLNSATLNENYDTRDDVFNPRRGWYINATQQFAGGLLKGDYDYSKYQLETRKYFPINKNVIALRAWGGTLSDGAPVTEYYYVGGNDTLRGYRDNLFYGTRMLVFNAEFRFPIGKLKMVSGAIFYDAGNAWKPGERSNLYSDVGIGIRLVFPTLGLGVIRLDYAKGE